MEESRISLAGTSTYSFGESTPLRDYCSEVSFIGMQFTLICRLLTSLCGKITLFDMKEAKVYSLNVKE